MQHHMHLNPTPFAQIKTGTKTIEVRLRDEKRRQIQTGDSITFSNRESGETLAATIMATHHFPTFKALYEHFPPISYGSQRTEEWEKMYQYYSPEEEQRDGVVGIEVRVVE